MRSMSWSDVLVLLDAWLCRWMSSVFLFCFVFVCRLPSGMMGNLSFDNKELTAGSDFWVRVAFIRIRASSFFTGLSRFSEFFLSSAPKPLLIPIEFP
jgi:hypothetical protein